MANLGSEPDYEPTLWDKILDFIDDWLFAIAVAVFYLFVLFMYGLFIYAFIIALPRELN